jgi:uncharacterized protein YcaQ
VDVHELSLQDARRIAVRAQLLDADPIAAVAPSADLVAWSRLGSTYRPADLVAAMANRDLIELDARLRPAEDLALYRAEMARWPGQERLRDWHRANQQWLAANDACRREILDRLDRSGPLPSRQLPDTCAVPWSSTGWTDNKNITRMLEFLVASGEVAVAGRQGRDRLCDLAERVYPDDPVVPADEALHRRKERRLRALGLARARGPVYPGEPADVGEAGEPVIVEGVRGQWRVDPDQLGRPFAGRVALLSPFDRLVHDRKRLVEIFGYEYQLEMYKPVAQRRRGYYALPILRGDELVGQLDATADRKAGVLRVAAIHQDVPFDAGTSAGVGAELDELARWLELEVRLAA